IALRLVDRIDDVEIRLRHQLAGLHLEAVRLVRRHDPRVHAPWIGRIELHARANARVVVHRGEAEREILTCACAFVDAHPGARHRIAERLDLQSAQRRDDVSQRIALVGLAVRDRAVRD
ncbi:MAG: hypothetical protein ACK56I_13070, partial [bacterium]